MERKHNTELTAKAKELRKNMTEEERRLWHDFLKTYSVRFLRQKVIDNYIVDFYCHQARLVIELDGSQHYEEKGLESDCKRDAYLKELGITVLRYSNLDIHKNFEGVCEDILKHINTSSVS